MNILLVKLSSLGDIVHAFPAVSEAQEHCPGTAIDWLVDPQYVQLPALHRGIRNIVTTGERRREAAGYDLVVDAQGLFRSALLARGWRAPVLGADGRSVREWPAHLLYDRPIFAPRHLHAADVVRTLLGAALGYDTRPLDRPSNPRDDVQRARTGRQVLLLHGTQQRCKEWPLDHWVAAAHHVAARRLTPMVTWSNPTEEALCRRLVAAVPATRIVPRMPMSGITDLIDQVALVVGVDTGLAHLADWRGCPTIMLFQASDPRLVGPSGPNSRMLWVGEPPRRTRRRDRSRPPRHPIVPPEQVTRAIDAALAAVQVI